LSLESGDTGELATNFVMRLARLARLVTLVTLASAHSAAVRPVLAQTIAGRVIESATRIAPSGLPIQILGDSGRVVLTTTTDTAGIFYATLPSNGIYRVRFAIDRERDFVSDTIPVRDDAFVQREFVVTFPRAYFEFEVQKQVQTMPHSPQPRYPADLKAANIEGEVLVQFVVDTTGRAELHTFKVLRSSDIGFAYAVRRVLPDMRFYPAEIGGRKVRQMVQQPFTFALTR
jgi:TonB family protein